MSSLQGTGDVLRRLFKDIVMIIVYISAVFGLQAIEFVFCAIGHQAMHSIVIFLTSHHNFDRYVLKFVLLSDLPIHHNHHIAIVPITSTRII